MLVLDLRDSGAFEAILQPDKDNTYTNRDMPVNENNTLQYQSPSGVISYPGRACPHISVPPVSVPDAAVLMLY